ncbi:Uncharacterized protein APZ42_013528 [Daphnia magna]|uniref:Uncharacterized protein n=1 Tax=Daphnia magna TaxID=35525 RepID=A0A162QSH0_9CRUS|nr:Uncharacterized protein APZ42_013528 [Daphnia magna]
MDIRSKFSHVATIIVKKHRENATLSYSQLKTKKGDVFTGDRYKQYVKDGLISEQTVTMQINTDGAQKFKSSKYSFWPFTGIINETGYKTRRSNVILMAIWFGNKKPPRNAFVDPCVVELEKLCTTVQFNGAYGCDFCLHPGKSVKIGKGSALVYCNRTDGTEPKYPLRSTFQYRNDLKEAIKGGKPFNGIKGPSTLAEIENFLLHWCVHT